jgi:SPP1 family predicted phage head-tail adaptor
MADRKYISASAMRHRAKLQQYVGSPDGQGGTTATWSNERDLWCQIRPMSATKRLEGAHRQSDETHDIYTRWAADINVKKRVVYDGQVYRIKSLWSPGELKQFLHIVASNTVES